jgi:hypothetical protein
LPNYWIRIELNTPERLRPHVADPAGLKREVFKIAAEHGSAVEHFYFDEGRTAAFALVQHHGDASPLFAALGADKANEKLLRIEEID